MKRLILSCLATASTLFPSSCVIDRDHHEHRDHDHHEHLGSTTTTTEEITVSRPVSSTVETQTIRPY